MTSVRRLARPLKIIIKKPSHHSPYALMILTSPAPRKPLPPVTNTFFIHFIIIID
jgi:hypothetical protein